MQRPYRLMYQETAFDKRHTLGENNLVARHSCFMTEEVRLEAHVAKRASGVSSHERRFVPYCSRSRSKCRLSKV